MSKKILIIGNGAKEYALAKELAKVGNIFVAPGNDSINEFATKIDIREDSALELLEFVMENDIDITIPISQKALATNLVNVFTENNQKIFAPSLNASKLIYDKAALKKVLYKLRIPTPKFGIFEKQNMAQDYIKNLKPPFVIKTNAPCSAVILTSSNMSKQILDSIFAEQNAKVIIEDYAWGTPFSYYVITDGYKALPIGSSITYKHSLEGDGGQLTKGMGACVPNYKISFENETFLMEEVVYPILEYLEAGGSPYLGILGISGVLTEEGKLVILGLEPFMQDSDCAAVLNLLDSNILELFESCIIGSFSDEVDYIPQKELSATSLVLTCRNKNTKENVIEGLENIEEDVDVSFNACVTKNRYLEYEANFGLNIILTAFARTVTSSTEKVYNAALNVNYKGLYYRKDICKPVSARI